VPDLSSSPIPAASGISPLSIRYDRLVESGQIRNDPAQREILAALQELCLRLVRQRPAEKNLFSRWFGKATPAQKAQGLYIWGNVGRGKSMLMDLFYEDVAVARKRRIHFHAFMQEVHARMHQLRQKGNDPIIILAQQLAQETSLLCFDELQATDVADAGLLFRLFQQLFESGVTIVSTSNHPPASLYTGGVQRERFAKFITLLEENMQVMTLSSAADYRHMQMKSMKKVYFHPLGPEADAFIETVLQQFCPDGKSRADEIVVHGRHTPFTLYNHTIGRFSFSELCEGAMGAADYLAISRRLDTVILTGIPRLPPEKRNEAKRFVTLIDALYEGKVKLICTAEGPPEQIYGEGDGSFEFTRTVSRLAEMQSASYLQE
jgi:cell division protein ZapE